MEGGSTDALRLVFVTAPSEDVARALARDMVERRLAACVTILPGVHSVYRWEGRTTEDDEVLMFLKTTSDRLDALVSWVSDHHPYDVPEVVAVPIIGGAGPYLAWVASAVSNEE